MKASIVISALLLLILPAFYSCSGRPDGVLGKEDMAQLIADIHAGESASNGNRAFQSDSARRALLEAIYRKHDVTREEVDSSFRWYGYHIDKYMDVYERVVDILQTRLDKAQELAGASAEGVTEISTSFEGDSVDVWPGIRWRRFASTMPGDILSFNLENAGNWERGDVYTLRAKTIANKGPFTCTFAVSYVDGKIEYVSRQMQGDGWHEMPVALDSARTAQRIYGVITYTPARKESAYIDSISLMRVRWGGHYRELRNDVRKFENRTLSGSASAHNPAPAEPLSVSELPPKTHAEPAPLPVSPARPHRPGVTTDRPARPIPSEANAAKQANMQPEKAQRAPRPQKR
ncbi:MAG: DUF4296 domain-containing protein [Muribaculaceae bacterium]|nr:DUF4296 domain-containing protein [Muribaculaceae bacterium]